MDEFDDDYPVEMQISDFNSYVTRDNTADMTHMIEKYGYDIDNVDSRGKTALHVAAMNSSLITLEFILSKVRNPNPLDHDGVSPLMITVGTGDVEMFSTIVKKMEEPIFRIRLLSTTHVKRDGTTLLMLACKSGRAKPRHGITGKSSDLVRILLDAGFSPYVKDKKGQTALHYAVQSERPDRTETLLILLKSMPDNTLVHLKDNDGNTPLHLACKNTRGNVQMLQVLLAHGARVSDTNLKQETPLHVVARLRVYELVPVLCDAGADTQARDIMGRTPTHAAVERLDKGWGRTDQNNSFHTFESLMLAWNPRYKLSYLDVKDKNGMTPLLVACTDYNLFSATRLIRIPGININAVDNKGITVLHACVRHGWSGMINELIRLGVKIHESDIHGETAMQLSQRMRHNSKTYEMSAELLRNRHALSQERSHAFSMGLHKRLGADSRIGDLNISEIQQMIARNT